MLERIERGLPVPVRRVAYRIAHRVLSAWWRVVHPRTEGVKCVLTDGDRVLFVRHTYGNRSLWELPGGGIRRGEPPQDAARREAREELGIDVGDWRTLGHVEVRNGKTTGLHCFTAALGDRVVRADAGEIAQSLWAPAADPPEPTAGGVREILGLL